MTNSAYSIKVEGNLIVVYAYRNWSVEEVQEVRKQIEAILDENHGPRDILASMGDFGAPQRDAMKEAIAFFREVPFDRIAAFGTKPARIVATNLVMRAAGSSDRLKIFRSEDDARAWLEEPYNNSGK